MLNTNNRKDEHLKYAEEQFISRQDQQSIFADCRIVHHSLGGANLDTVDISTNLFGQKFPSPLFINAMTGGSARSLEVNRKLAILAEECQLIMATGSMSNALRNPELADSFTVVRKYNPDGFIIANIGAEQSLENAQKVIELIKADAIQIHLNVAEELIMPEGDRDFTHYKDNLAKLIQGLDIPVIVKEVGFGMSRETIKDLVDMGCDYIDISGTGGTNFIQVENARREEKEYTYLNDFGQNTVISLLEAQNYLEQTNIIASGGIINPLDVVKCLALGAKACGASAYFLHEALNYSEQEMIARMHKFNQELKVMFTIFNSKDINDLQKLPLVITGAAREWCEARNLDYQSLANK